MRVLALDWGSVRIGGAISDEDGKIAFPLDRFFDPKSAVTEIKNLAEEKNVELVLLGNPKNLQGEESQSSREVGKFFKKLTEAGLKVMLLDERFTSVEAEKILHSAGVKLKDQRQTKDNLAAQLMLQQYLDTNH